MKALLWDFHMCHVTIFMGIVGRGKVETILNNDH